MPRPRLSKKIGYNPEITYFKPSGVRMRQLEIVDLTLEEVEALRLKNTKNLDQTECAKIMNTSQSTFQRILSSAYDKIASALIFGKAIKINKEGVIMPEMDGTGPAGQGPVTGRGRGMSQPGQGLGGSGECECPKCGAKSLHTRGIPCSNTNCPKCGTPMRGVFCR
jgi:uncharacterized protein